MENVPQARYEGEQDEEADIEDEKNDGYDLEPVAIVRELMEQDGHYASGHCNYKPSVANRPLSQRLITLCSREVGLQRQTYDGVKFLIILRNMLSSGPYPGSTTSFFSLGSVPSSGSRVEPDTCPPELVLGCVISCACGRCRVSPFVKIGSSAW